MTCHAARERLSALLDDALAPDEAREVAAHLEGCPECRRERARLEQTVALVHRVQPPRAPVGFVDRVVEAARPRPWYRRLAVAIFLPFSVKLPAEATALVMVALLAVYLFEGTPALQESARRLEPARERPSVPPPAPVAQPPARPESGSRQHEEEKAREPGSEAEPQLLKDARRRDQSARSGDAPPSATPTPPPPSEPAPTAPALPPAQAPPVISTPPAGTRPPAAAPPVASAPPTTEPPPASSSAGSPVPAPAAPAPAPPGKAETTTESRQGGNRGQSLDASRSATSPRLAAKRAAPADVVARIAVRDRETAEAELRALLARVGGRETGRRRDEDTTMVDAIVPRVRYAEFLHGLDGLGTWTLEADRPNLPAEVRLILRLQ